MNAREPGDGLSRRGLFAAVGSAVAAVVVTQVGATATPLKGLSLLGPRRADIGPQSLPVNKTAVSAGVVAASSDAGYRLVVEGRVRTPLSLSLAELQSLPQSEAETAIACVEGWSASALWSGIRLSDLLAEAGAEEGRRVQVQSLQATGNYRSSELDVARVRDPQTLLAMRISGQPLHMDHGFPVRLIAPNRPGVLQTKWLNKVVVL